MNIAAGGAAGAATQTIVYPLDYARTRLANQVKQKNINTKIQFSGLIDCLKKTYKTDGAEGLYRGFTVSCLCMIIYRGLYFGIYDTVRPFLPMKYNENMIATFALGYVATITSGACSYPLDTVRRRMMMTSGEAVKYKSSMHAFAQITAKEGVRSLFKGAGANILRAIAGAGALAGYDKLQFIFLGKTYGSGAGGG